MTANGVSVHHFWKDTALFLAGVVLTLMGVWATHVRNAVSRDEMENYVNQRLSTLDSQIAELNRNVIDLEKVASGLKAEIEATRGKK